MHITMSSLCNSLVGSALFALLRPRILRNSTLLMVSFTQILLMDLSGFSAINAKTHIMSTACAQIKRKPSGGPFIALLMNVRSDENFKQVTSFHLKQVTKQVTSLVLVAKQKMMKQIFWKAKMVRELPPQKGSIIWEGKERTDLV